MATTCPAFANPPPLPSRSSSHPLARKVTVVETTTSVEEITEEEEDQVIGRLSTSPKDKYNQDL